jgi:hypothetical protein
VNACQFRRPPLAAEVDERGRTAVVIDESHLLDHQELMRTVTTRPPTMNTVSRRGDLPVVRARRNSRRIHPESQLPPRGGVRVVGRCGRAQSEASLLGVAVTGPSALSFRIKAFFVRWATTNWS